MKPPATRNANPAPQPRIRMIASIVSIPGDSSQTPPLVVRLARKLTSAACIADANPFELLLSYADEIIQIGKQTRTHRTAQGRQALRATKGRWYLRQDGRCRPLVVSR